ncbi:MAG: 3-oxoacyl-[acyl-carrier-protein] synthase [Solirubrobacteraceae bacterium]|jgi:3-oxoacyl-[acyl-carrier-protein] synthase-3|nr:3-oxoacyl-[acyl-carrier-protein] synthase [Solirubrobacteraceae bacterium]
MKAGVFGIGAALPEAIVTNFDLEKHLDTTDEWIVRRTGIRERRHLNGSRTLADLAAEACTAALVDAGRDPADVDRVIVCSLTPDRLMPGMAPAVAEKIGCDLAGAVDMNAACAGFLYALDDAAALVESGRAKLVVVCGAEALSRITDHADRGTAILFADGAGAVVVAAGELERGICSFELRSDGSHANLLYVDRDERLLRMEGREVYRHAVARMCEATRAALVRAGIGIDDVDVFVAHQANARIIESVARELGVPEQKVMMNIALVANTSSASIPLALQQAEFDGRLKPGDTVAMATFGAGFAWGAGVMSWKERVRATA